LIYLAVLSVFLTKGHFEIKNSWKSGVPLQITTTLNFPNILNVELGIW
jgi:hypothetical protein